MKKIYTHELNEAKATKAILRCFMKKNGKIPMNESAYGIFQKPRPEEYDQDYWEYGVGDAPLDGNAPRQEPKEEQEESDFKGMSKMERSLLIRLEQQMPALIDGAMSRVRDHEDPESIKKLILDIVVKKFVPKMAEKIGASWEDFSTKFKRELKNVVINSIADFQFTSEEQEEIGATGMVQEMEESP